MANLITFFRVIIALFALCILRMGPSMNLIGVVLIIISMLLDALDGFVARHFNNSTLQGSIYDILADRIIENLFFVYFAVMSLFSVWVAVIIVIRGLIIDAIRTLHVSAGSTAFGETTLQKKKWAKFLTCSKLSRGSYNFFKMLTFVSYAAVLQPVGDVFSLFGISIQYFANICLWITVTIALLRAIPVILEGWIVKPSFNHQ